MPLSEAALAECHELIARYPTAKCALLQILWVAQREYGSINQDVMREVAELLRIRPVEVADVVSFYFMYRKQPMGTYTISVCDTLSCALLGAFNLIDYLEGKLGIKCGQTTPDGRISLEAAECLGACSDAPVLTVDFYHQLKVTPEKIDELLARMERGEEIGQEMRPPEWWETPTGWPTTPMPDGQNPNPQPNQPTQVPK
ncbi:MAG: NADH-quinone oxidoreductase subunit NuoE [Armatimonadetes bacterium]|nr:NADH-quinone oxidoreductase subunit NuoE [Armatimonadota bacterium]